MQSTSSEALRRVVILATGGTIAGTAASATDSLDYIAGQLGIAQLVAAMPALGALAIEAEQVAQIDSKDLDFALWRTLAQRLSWHLARPEVAGAVVTHGSDTLEETAYVLQRTLAPAKPVVLTGAMRPATALQADGPQNLFDAVTLAREPGARGVLVAFAGAVFSALDVRKVHTCRLDAFGGGDAGPLGRIESGRLRRWRDWPGGQPLGAGLLDTEHWPRVEIVLSHAGASGAVVEALLAQGVEGLVVAGTGNGTLHHALEAALLQAQTRGVAVRRASRVGDGPVQGAGDEPLPGAGALTAVQARIELMLELLGAPLTPLIRGRGAAPA